jgi:hypothetical protein
MLILAGERIEISVHPFWAYFFLHADPLPAQTRESENSLKEESVL